MLYIGMFTRAHRMRQKRAAKDGLREPFAALREAAGAVGRAVRLAER